MKRIAKSTRNSRLLPVVQTAMVANGTPNGYAKKRGTPLSNADEMAWNEDRHAADN